MACSQKIYDEGVASEEHYYNEQSAEGEIAARFATTKAADHLNCTVCCRGKV
jgi:hypothetical protein